MGNTYLQVRLEVQGMTCTGCEEHVEQALKSIGAVAAAANFRRNEATFQVSSSEAIEAAKQAIEKIGYHPGDAQILNEPKRSVSNTATMSNEDYEYDLLIIGSGGAAFSAAIQAVGRGAKVVMIERGIIGGTCVNIGCVPSKTMLRAGEINHLAHRNPFQGLQTSADPVNLKQLIEQKNQLVADLRQQKYVDLIAEYGFTLIHGEARFLDPQTVEVEGRQMTAKHFLIATGASPYIPEIPGLADIDYLTSTTALELQEVPKRLAVIGSGYIAMELGQLFRNLGSDVTLMQRSNRVLKSYDPEVSEAITQALTDQGIHMLTGVTFHKVEQQEHVKRVYVTANGSEQMIEADQILVAAGRQSNTKSLNLEAADVKIGERGEIVVDQTLCTTNPRIYAAGDVTMGPQFVYVAAYEGALVVENTIGGANKKLDLRTVPGVTFTNPSIATVGLTEEQAKADGFEVLTSVLPLDAVPRALVNRETTGVFKLVADAKTRKVLGAHIVAENAGDVIYAATLIIKFGLTIEDLRETLAPYLTMAEGIKLASLTFDRDVSKLSCCAG
ncbi:mercury(II) reductase [Fodinisporobacter ferrooxydans]